MKPNTFILLGIILIVGVASDQLSTIYGLSLGAVRVENISEGGEASGYMWRFDEGNPYVVRYWPWWILVDWCIVAAFIGSSYIVRRLGVYGDVVTVEILAGAGLVRFAACLWNISNLPAGVLLA
jgi:hypothetical protein